jgi:ribonuclease P protein component
VAPRGPGESEPTGRFSKSARVRKRREYQRIQTGGRRLSLAHFVLIFRAREDSSGARLGITASRKVGGAVVRNRMRRLIREAFRCTRELFPDDIDVVVIVKSAPAEFGLADVVHEWRAAERPLKKRLAEARGELKS